MATSSLNDRTKTLADGGWTILKLMNYHLDDYEEILAAINQHVDGLQIKSMETVTHLKFGAGGRRFTMVGAKLNLATEWSEHDLEQGQTINLADHFDCSNFSGSRSPQLKHCPVGGRNSQSFSAVAFNVIHNSATAEKVIFEILTQIKELCKDKQEITDMEDTMYLDVRYSRKDGYLLNALSTQFSNVMKNVLSITSKLKLDKFGEHKTLSTSVGEERRGRIQRRHV